MTQLLKGIVLVLWVVWYFPRVQSSIRAAQGELSSIWNKGTFNQVNFPSSGLQEVLNEDLYWIWESMKALHVDHFQAYGSFPPDSEWGQRLDESNWPIRQVEKSNWVILFSKELNQIGFRDCALAAQKKEITLVHCLQ